jgi:hypothetical protein
MTGTSPQRTRVDDAFAHRSVDRTPLFELFWPYHPIYWDICGRTVATDMAMAWDARADGIAWEEEVEALARADVQMAEFFELDMMLVGDTPSRGGTRPERIGDRRWRKGGTEYAWNADTCRVEPVNAAAEAGNWVLHGESEADFRRRVESLSGDRAVSVDPESFARLVRVKELLDERGLDIPCMSEVGAGTAAAQYPPCMWMWMLDEPELYERWLDDRLRRGLAEMAGCLERGADAIALGGDVSSDQGPLISPELYRRYILPAVRRQIELVHRFDAYAVYTSDGNLWPIKDEFFTRSGADGYKEVDMAAGMTMERLVEEGIDRQITIIGNIDARHTLCNGTPEEIARQTRTCLDLGLKSPGGHILHTSHSVHEGVPVAHYYAVWNAYRSCFGLPARERPRRTGRPE